MQRIITVYPRTIGVWKFLIPFASQPDKMCRFSFLKGASTSRLKQFCNGLDATGQIFVITTPPSVPFLYSSKFPIQRIITLSPE